MLPENDPPAASEQPPPERRFILWAALLFAANILCVLMLAARSASPPNLRGYYDIAIFICLVGGASFAVIRLMFFFPYRLLDLVVIVLVMSIGMKFAVDGARYFQPRELYEKTFSTSRRPPPREDAEQAPGLLLAEWCILTGCVLLGGASLGLRHCRLLKIDAPVKRAFVLACGMLAMPAPLGLVTIPFLLLNKFIRDKAESGDAPGWIAALALSFIATLVNTVLALRTIVLKTEIAAQEHTWREKQK